MTPQLCFVTVLRISECNTIDCGISLIQVTASMETNHSDPRRYVMPMSNTESDPNGLRGAAGPPVGNPDRAARVEMLTERQCSYLRLVLQLKTSKQIAQITGTGYRAVDKHLMMANNILGASTRFEAARMLADHEAGVGSPYPANALPSEPPNLPLSRPWPTVGAAVNMLPWRQVATWTTIISVVTPVGLTTAGMAYLTLLLLLRLQPF